VRVTLDGDPTVHQGRVVRLSPSIAEGNRTLLVEAGMPNPRGTLRPGSFAKAEIVTQSDDRAVMVPQSAIVTFAGIQKVITVKDGKTTETRVQTGRRVGDSVEIVAGLQGGELVVPQPGNLTGGQAVTVAR
jgi:RND family efflux transporter MFP subunit